MKPIAIFGGTFNPIHHGHLRVAIEVKERLDLDSVRMIPLYAPAHRAAPETSAKQRYEMLAAATLNEPEIIADDREITRKGISYTFDTLTELRDQFAARPLCLLIGTDAFLHLHRWHRWQELIDLAHLVLIHRPAIELPKNVPAMPLLADRETTNISDLHENIAGRFMSISIPRLEISSTQLREILQNGNNPRYLLPENVLEIIRKNRLYQ